MLLAAALASHLSSSPGPASADKTPPSASQNRGERGPAASLSFACPTLRVPQEWRTVRKVRRQADRNRRKDFFEKPGVKRRRKRHIADYHRRRALLGLPSMISR